MVFTKISSVSLTELFVQQIENMILSGDFHRKAPGEVSMSKLSVYIT